MCVEFALYYFFNGKKSSWQLVVQISLCGGNTGMLWEKTTAYLNTNANCIL
jgi:hypothetical protein